MDEPVNGRPWVWSLVLSVVVLLLYGGVRDFALTLDSVPIVGLDKRVAQGDVVALTTGDWWDLQEDPASRGARPSLWRPLSKLWLSLLHPRDGQLRGAGATLPGIMLGNVLLHAVLCVLRFHILLALLRPCRAAVPAAFVAALALAVHPAHTESVATAVGAADSLAAIFVCSALLLQLRMRGAWSAVLQGLAVLLALSSKEAAVAAPAFACLLAFAGGATVLRSLRAALPSFVALLMFLALRTAVLGDPLGISDPVFALFTVSERMSTALAVIAVYDVQALFLPFWLNPNLTLLDVPPASGLADWRALAGLALLLAALLGVVWALRRGQRLVACGIAGFLCALLPVSNLPFSIGALGATRFLVMPLLGFGMVLAALIVTLHNSRHRVLGVGVLCLFTVLVPLIATYRELPRWKGDGALFQSMTERSPNAAFGWYNLGVYEQQHGRTQLAAQHFERACALPLPRIPSKDVVQEDLLESAFQARMNAAGIALQGAVQRASLERALGHYAAAAEVCRDGLRSSAVRVGGSRWEQLLSEALVGCARAQAVLTLRGASQATALEFLDQARNACSDNLAVDSTAAWLAEVTGDGATALRLHEALDPRARALWSSQDQARGISRERAQLLERFKRVAEAQRLRLEVALAGRGREAPEHLLAAAQGATGSGDAATRKLQQQALEAWFVDERNATVAQRIAADALLRALR
ncbi:MAG: hypothetical protein EXS14_04955 [Planctomycetes bacterium]|nr:hypothetical protein [Planctomycetota bacterium]